MSVTLLSISCIIDVEIMQMMSQSMLRLAHRHDTRRVNKSVSPCMRSTLGEEDFMSCLNDAFDEAAGAKMDLTTRWFREDFRDMMIRCVDCQLPDDLIVQLSAEELKKYVTVRGYARLLTCEKIVDMRECHDVITAIIVYWLKVPTVSERSSMKTQVWKYFITRVDCGRRAWDHIIIDSEILNGVTKDIPLMLDRMSVALLCALGRNTHQPHVQSVIESVRSVLERSHRVSFNSASFQDFLDAETIINPYCHCTAIDGPSQSSVRDQVLIVLRGIRTQDISLMQKIRCIGVGGRTIREQHISVMDETDLNCLLRHSGPDVIEDKTSVWMFRVYGETYGEKTLMRVMAATTVHPPVRQQYFKTILQYARRLYMYSIVDICERQLSVIA